MSLMRPVPKTRVLTSALVCALFWGHQGYAQTPSQEDVTQIPELAPVATQQFHAASSQELIWSDDDFSDLLDAIAGLERHGLNPNHYHLNELKALQSSPQERDRVATDAWFSAAANMLYGKLDPLSVEPDWTAASREADLASELSRALAEGSIDSSLEKFAPTQRSYQTMLQEYDRLRNQLENPVTFVPAGESLKPGMIASRVGSLQNRLVELDLLGLDYIPDEMDEATVEAVKLFQFQAGLEEDGVVGRGTLAALNRGPQQQLEQVRVNLERWRWLPNDLGRRHIRVNIAGFYVEAWEGGEVVQTHLAIIGKLYRKTPVFSDQVEYAVLSPWWEVPSSIARIDKLPLFKKDPSSVTAMGFQVLDSSGNIVDLDSIDWNNYSSSNFPFRLRQMPGEQNALGQVKMMFPNPHNVYLHDTPSRGLFAQRQRAFSSGCIRVQDPLELTAWLLEETPNWTKEEIDSAVLAGKETRATLQSFVPVHVLYFTTVVEENGQVRYLDDIYSRDQAVLLGLQKVHN